MLQYALKVQIGPVTIVSIVITILLAILITITIPFPIPIPFPVTFPISISVTISTDTIKFIAARALTRCVTIDVLTVGDSRFEVSTDFAKQGVWLLSAVALWLFT
ncbi:hypothetical protein EWM64_g7878 [Hericium alpestre]|uniref:Uncharacterized protein n=1 Tax=Hericium alpestre TaxID=135208 RepID=A0A4Y9ZMQ1_9AGAM|nr:hypothetical protein EWM64_g7878 [Hericium alpestre]